MYAIIQNLYENFPVLEQKRYQKLTYCLLFIAVWLINIPGLIPVLYLFSRHLSIRVYGNN
jgi:hypothetical protein